MANRRFEMHQYRQVVFRMRMGESDRSIAKSGLIAYPYHQAVQHIGSTASGSSPCRTDGSRTRP